MRRRTGDWRQQQMEPIVRLWTLRTLVDLGGERQFLYDGGFRDNVLARQLGLEETDPLSSDDFDAGAVRTKLRQMLREAEEDADSAVLPPTLAANLNSLGDQLGLSEIDGAVLAFAVLLEANPALSTATGFVGELTSNMCATVMEEILDLPHGSVMEALKPRSLLSESGLLRLDRGYNRRLDTKLDLISDGFSDAMMWPAIDPIDLLRDVVSPAPAPQLGPADYEHVSDHVDLLLPYLRQAVQGRRTGANVLLYGPPGTGKSQLCRVLAKELAIPLYEVSSENADGDPVSARGRLRALRAAQCLFRNRPAVLAFDEIEDVFAHSGFSPDDENGRRAQKAWINRMLEANPIPTIWVCNHVGCLDPAFVRRFDIVAELPIPPRRQRQKIIETVCDGIADAQTVARLASNENLSPAVVARAASVVAAVSEHGGTGMPHKSIELLVESTLRAQGHRDRPGQVSPSNGIYDLSLINADVDLAELAENLARARTGRLCLFGPPGTGKTAFARWLADRLDKPLLVRRASDLLGAYVGENEKNVAAAFRAADRDDAVLLIDEVETFLNDRRGAHRSWEASLVNEMLCQMESFEGVFVASTNMMDMLDSAALRRFDAKVEFDYLRPEQAVELLRRHCRVLGLGEPCGHSLRRIEQLDQLTPGDFAAVARRSRISAIGSPEAFLAALREECRLKEGRRHPIGFTFA